MLLFIFHLDNRLQEMKHGRPLLRIILLFLSIVSLAPVISNDIEGAESVVFSLEKSPSSERDYELQAATNGHTLYSSLISITYEPSNAGEINISTSINGLSLASNTSEEGTIQIALASANGVGGSATLATISFAGSAPDSISLTSVRVNEGGTPSTALVAHSTTLSGYVYLWGDTSKPVAQVQVVMIQNGSQQTETTQSDGSFSFDVDGSGEIQLSAIKTVDDKVAAGVDVSDIVQMRKHILAMEQLPNYPSLIAADPTRDNSIDVSDIVSMRKLILAMENSYSKDASGQPESLWRFFDREVVTASNQEDLGKSGSLEIITLNPAAESLSNLVITGVKLGDVNGDW